MARACSAMPLGYVKRTQAKSLLQERVVIEEKAPEDVATALESDPQAVYLDVRTEGEFVQGHVPRALNVPVAGQVPATGTMAPNPDFMSVVRASISLGATVYCGCASGPRSRYAVTLLQHAGYTDVSNVTSGFSGVVDPLGRVLEPGWAARGLPVEAGDGGPFGYVALRAAAESSDG
jgi:rhodanese-related sulfurtransferase